ncbi:MAG: GntR family transcriptional regulator [Lachnospiraceae bacterium]|nr:GntR family transcriptional regulator [Lachnospiraceae bacterium]
MKKNIFDSPISNKSVVDRIVDQITEAIIAGDLKPGDKIPTEVEICESLQVGRNSVREAIKVLEAFGVIYIKRAEGTFVSSSFNRRMLDSMLYGLILQKESNFEIVELRHVFDIGILYEATEKVDDISAAKVEESLKEMEKVLADENATVDEVLERDLFFHRSIIDCTKNQLLSTMYDYIIRLTIPSRIKATERIFATGNRQLFLQLHQQMFQLLKNRDKSMIEETVKNHYMFWRKEE